MKRKHLAIYTIVLLLSLLMLFALAIIILEKDGRNNLMTANPQNQQLGDWQK